MPLVRLQYNGTARYFETPITGSQQSWMPGQSGFVDDSFEAALIATGLFSYYEKERVFKRKNSLITDDGSTISTTTGSGSVAVQDEGTQVAAAAARLNFVGAGVTAAVNGGDPDRVDVTIPGGTVSAESALDVPPLTTNVPGYSNYGLFCAPKSEGLSLGGWPRRKTLALFAQPSDINFTLDSGNAGPVVDYSDNFVGMPWDGANSRNGRSLRITASNGGFGGSYRFVRNSVNTVPADVTGCNIYVQIKLLSGTATAIGNLQLRLYSGATPNVANADYHAGECIYPNHNVRVGQWQTVAVPIQSFSAVGAGATLTSITHVGFQGGNGAADHSYLIGSVFACPQTLARGAAVIAFDDCRSDTWTDAARYMVARGIPGTLYPGAIADKLRLSQDQFQMTAAQLRRLQDMYGWQVGSQAWDTESPTATLRDFAGDMSALKAMYAAEGWDGAVDGSYFSNVSLGSSYDPVFRRAFRTMRSYVLTTSTVEVDAAQVVAVPIPDPYNIQGFAVDLNTHTLAQLTGMVDKAIARKGAVVFCFHESSVSNTKFTGLIDYLDANRATVDAMTMDQLIFASRVRSFL